MYMRDFSVPQAIKEIIISNDFYLKAIKLGIVNYTAFADELNKADNYLLTFNNNQITESNHNQNESKDTLFSLPQNDVRMTLIGSIIDINFNKDSAVNHIPEIIKNFSKDTVIDYNLIH